MHGIDDISAFRHSAYELIVRKGQKFVGNVNTLGDFILMTVPAVQAGVAGRLADRHEFFAAYGNRPWPLVIGLLLMTSSHVSGKEDVRLKAARLAVRAKGWALGGLGYITAGSLFAIDYALHGQSSEAWGMAPTIGGGIMGAVYGPLERRWGAHPNSWVRQTAGSPKSMTGILFLGSSVWELGAAIAEGITKRDWSLLPVAAFWTLAGAVNLVLPRDDEKSESMKARRPVYDPYAEPSGRVARIFTLSVTMIPR